MDAPVVYIDREPLIQMLSAAVEVYNKECIGWLFGSGPTRRKPGYHIRSALVAAGVVRRTNICVHVSARCNARLFDFLTSAQRLTMRPIGDFHSHPAYRGVSRSTELSDGDISDMRTEHYQDAALPLSVLIRLKERGKRNASWRRLDRGTRLRGSLGRYTFDVRVWRLRSDDPAQSSVEALPIEISPAVRKVLNRVRKRS